MTSPAEILNPSLGELEWDNLQQLLCWPEALLHDLSEKPVHTAKPEVFEEDSDWSYKRDRSRFEAEYPDRTLGRKGEKVSAMKNYDFARKIGIHAEPVMESQPGPFNSNPPGFEEVMHDPRDRASFARPGVVALQQRQEFPAANPLLGEFPAPAWTPGESTDTLLGSQWLFDELTGLLMEVRLMPPKILECIGIEAAAQVVHAHLSFNTPEGRLMAVLAAFQEQEIPRVADACQSKLRRINDVAAKLRVAWQVPFMGLDGEVDLSITLTNMATIATALENLDSLYSKVEGFTSGASIALGAIMDFIKSS